MDVFLEGQVWPDFHHAIIEAMREWMIPRVRPRYVVRVEERVYVEHALEPGGRVIRPDVSLVEPEGAAVTRIAGRAPGAALADRPITLTLPMPEEVHETFLTIRERERMTLVAVIELLSPANKRAGSDGQREYQWKRESVLRSAAHLLELDLLRAGERLRTLEPLPDADYYAFLSRADRRPLVDVYRWMLRDPLPVVPVPLSGGEPDVPLDLQQIFDAVYSRAGYDYSLDYAQPVEPRLSEEDARWVAAALAGRAAGTG